ncbi:hypothetical protein QQP08_018364 [Theobroma cacao]|uniref:Secreted protein n=1 Tax=Theobroma cacao TaxID=3641 RepID=A0A061GII0_THECC|nr:Uncharacterized protein TCM_030431 [Theobroma cacao]WRX25877.1 hypothetical protein QQP08_018364 [Theobroma cacao]
MRQVRKLNSLSINCVKLLVMILYAHGSTTGKTDPQGKTSWFIFSSFYEGKRALDLEYMVPPHHMLKETIVTLTVTSRLCSTFRVLGLRPEP